ncbi:Nramp family divalent metal transporter [Nocardioides sp. InS609-2]|uniref:Nramp family divalent metal transporter n=1 Tax=Nocardioides sp. InS609-2 TaxID=2760705 RepID=UPI0017CA0111|nr:Nramp family divalent metal transporter [Nocardioides sp. InS609-2]MBA3781541.1 Nramp family divalent metal transporter [Nocardioides sp.]
MFQTRRYAPSPRRHGAAVPIAPELLTSSLTDREADLPPSPGPRRTRQLWPLLGPAFVTAIAYVDPGNFATNITAGSTYGYLLVWVIIVSNLMAMLIQYLSAKAGVATGKSLPALCRDNLPRPMVRGLWVQAELVAIATDLAEVVGGALALKLLFDLPLLVGGTITAVVAFALLGLKSRGHRPFEAVITGLLGVILMGFVYDIAISGVDSMAVLDGTMPRFAGTDSILIAAGMLGATVMPHAIYLHGALTSERFRPRTEPERRTVMRSQRIDVVAAMSIAGLMNLSLLLIAASALSGQNIDSIEGAYAGLNTNLGPASGLLFALGLLASGFASSSVGTLSGQIVMEGFLRRRIPLTVRRLVTLLPALIIIGVGVDPTRALVLSQVVLSFGIPFALVPLIWFTRRSDLMGSLVNRRTTTIAGAIVAAMIIALNAVLLVQLA